MKTLEFRVVIPPAAKKDALKILGAPDRWWGRMSGRYELTYVIPANERTIFIQWLWELKGRHPTTEIRIDRSG